MRNIPVITNFIAKKFHLGLTLRGTISLIFIIVLLWPIFLYGDITATIFFYVFLLTFLSVFITIWLKGHSLKKTLKISVNPEMEDDNASSCYAGKETIIVLKIPACNIFPLFNLTIKIRFQYEDLKPATHIIKGKLAVTQSIPFRITFPHRGIWNVDSVEVSFNDQFGLCFYRWSLTSDDIRRSFKVFPLPHSSNHLPMLSSFYRTGDLISGTNERRGEPFDIKRYHPSDGVKKISWKIYARSRELVSRHQEIAASPEGQVAVFALARKEDDLTAAVAISYVERLLKSELEVVYNCEGCRLPCAKDIPQVKRNLLADVWSIKESDTAKDVLDFTKVATPQGAQLKSLLMLLEATRFQDITFLKDLKKIAKTLLDAQIEPVFLIAKPVNSIRESKHSPSVKTRVFSWFTSELQTEQTKSYYDDFLQLALANNWQIFLEEDV